MQGRRWRRGPAYDGQGTLLGTVVDLVIDVERAGPAPVTDVVVRGPDGETALHAVAGSGPDDAGRWVVGESTDRSIADLSPTQVLLRRDVLDAPVVTVAPHRRGRVSDVLLEAGPQGLAVTGVDTSPRGVLRRLTGRPPVDRESTVPLSSVHLASHRGHAAQLASPDALVRRLPADALAELLTRISPSHARDVVRATDPEVGGRAVELLHPTVRARVTGTDGPPRRMRRTHGWRLHRPSTRPRDEGRR